MAWQSKQDRHEVPCGTGYAQGDSDGHYRGGSLTVDTTLWDAHRQPENEFEALMVCDFGEEPPAHHDPMFLDEIETASQLTDRERATLGFVVYGGMSLQKAGYYLGAEFPRKGVPYPYTKTSVARFRASALAKIRKHLEETEYVNIDMAG